MTRIPLLVSFLLCLLPQLCAQPVQTIRGVVADEASNHPIAFATVALSGTKVPLGTMTDTSGHFSIAQVPVGRYEVQVTLVGYDPVLTREVSVVSGKQTFLTIYMRENTTQLREIVVKPRVNKALPLNTMATLSAKMLSVEEAKRYAGGFDDPARLATSIAGASGNTGDNGIIIRGNAPKFMQWKMEGIEIPVPSHFGDLNYLGGGVLTALSSQMLANSDFFTGAFPAEYSNALSGVFDIAMRSGNNQKRESTLQLGLIGLENASEGPIKKGGRASYLYNFRYSTLALLKPLLPEDAESIQYQDLSFKLNFPTQKVGVFSFWGMGFTDKASAKPKKDPASWKYPDDNEDNVIQQQTAVLGMSHKVFFNNNTYLKTTVAATSNTVDWTAQKLNKEQMLRPFSKIANTNSSMVLSTFVNKKISSQHTNKTGVLLTSMQYDILLNKADHANEPPREIVRANGQRLLASAYSSSVVHLTDHLTMNAGINAQIFTLNNHYTVEPRLGIRYQVADNQAIAVAYGVHSRLEKLNYYFNNSLETGEKAVNKNLDFSKAQHFILGYDWAISDLLHLKIEPYFQYLYSIPVIADSSFSFINLQSDLFFSSKLENTGKGRNYGVDLMLEKYISNGFYYVFSGSVFKAEYKGGDDIWRNTRYNRSYVVNFLMGKEWQVGRNKQNTLSLNARVTHQGGNRYSPVDEAASVLQKMVVYDETAAFSMQSAPLTNVHFTAVFKINKRKRSSEIALKILNLTRQADFRGHLYNFINNRVDEELPSLMIPNVSYKIEF
jgi:hypothetical protein